VGAFWRGEISLRQLRVYKEHLPPTSAVHRAMHEGQQWTNLESLLWRANHLLETIEARLVWGKGVRPKWPKFKSFPWSKGVTIGDRGAMTSKQSVDYLKSVGPQGGGPNGS
jgi:hypothetical protein